MSSFLMPTRRNVLKTAGLAAGALATPALMRSSFAAGQLTVADVGGAPGEAIKKTFYEPFEKATGIKVVGVAHDPDPVTQFKLQVDTKSYLWDVCMVTPDHVMRLSEDKQYIAPLEIDSPDTADILPGMLTDNWLGFSVFGAVMAYRTDKFKEAGPSNWAEFWDVEKFPGRRGFYKGAWAALEFALLADGVAPKDLYPLDMDRAFKKLEELKEHVSVWWTSGAHNTQILQNGEVDATDTWSARAYAATASGAPVKTVWQGGYSVDGWSIVSGAPNTAAAHEFIKFCMKPEQQAAYTSIVANGPTNKKSFDFMPAERRAVLPTAPENFGNLYEIDSKWWSTNYDEAVERMQEFLLL
jgi:putative spermidine/putrescine transport system substrate-binding protein